MIIMMIMIHDAHADNEVHWHVDCDFVHPSLYHTAFQVHANYVVPLIARSDECPGHGEHADHNGHVPC